MQEHGQMANEAVKEPFTCLVCDEAAGFNWSDRHGEAMCNRCGTPYMLFKDGKCITPAIAIKENWLPVLRQYWGETHKYMGLGTIMSMRSYPECAEGRNAFNSWLDEHKNILPQEEEGGGLDGAHTTR